MNTWGCLKIVWIGRGGPKDSAGRPVCWSMIGRGRRFRRISVSVQPGCYFIRAFSWYFRSIIYWTFKIDDASPPFTCYTTFFLIAFINLTSVPNMDTASVYKCGACSEYILNISDHLLNSNHKGQFQVAYHCTDNTNLPDDIQMLLRS